MTNKREWDELLISSEWIGFFFQNIRYYTAYKYIEPVLRTFSFTFERPFVIVHAYQNV